MPDGLPTMDYAGQAGRYMLRTGGKHGLGKDPNGAGGLAICASGDCAEKERRRSQLTAGMPLMGFGQKEEPTP